MNATDLAPLRRVAADWRKTTTPPANDPATYSRGYVITIDGEVSGWTRELQEPVTSWRPGCLAIPADDGPCFEAVGGDYMGGAERWEDTRIPALRAIMEKEPDVTRVIAIRPSQQQPDRSTSTGSTRITGRDRHTKSAKPTPNSCKPTCSTAANRKKTQNAIGEGRPGQPERCSATFSSAYRRGKSPGCGPGAIASEKGNRTKRLPLG